MIRGPFVSLATTCALGCVIGALGTPARADEAASPPPLVPLPYDMKLSGHVEAGISINPDSPDNNINFGQLFTDQANTFRMNQAMLTLERDLDPKNAGYQWGFKLQGMYGTDARITHFYDEFDRATNSPYQWDITELAAMAHLPYWWGGTDVTVGQYPTPLGAETIDATGNTFYSKSYIFNYGLPLKHTGVLTTTHVTNTVDLWLGFDTGNNDSLGQKGMANNEFPKGIVGFGLNNLDAGKLTVLALAHIGPETPRFTEATNPATVEPAGGPAALGFGIPSNPGANSDMVQLYDIVTTYKINDAWTTTSELNYVKNDFLGVSAGGAAQYLSYALNDQWTISGRAEFFGDQNKGKGGIVCNVENSTGFVDAERGLAPTLGYCGGPAMYNATYGEVTLGATYKPSLPWNQLNFMIRPEFRYDTIIGGTAGVKPFDVTNASGLQYASGATTSPGTKSDQFTLAVDFIIGF